MRWSWLRTVILGLLIGPAPVSADSVDVPEMPDGDLCELEGTSGHVAVGSHFYVWDEDPREAASWALELRQLGGAIGASRHWQGVAARTAALPPVLTGDEEVELEASVQVAEREGISPLGVLLCLLPSLDRTCLISSWATSPDEPTRRALARALAVPFEAVGVRGAIEHLQGDPSPEVRRLARSASAARRAPLG